MLPSPADPGSVQPSEPNLLPTRARHVALGFIVVLAIITYVDRVCISQAAPDIRRDLGLNEKQMGWVFSAFTLTYALFEIPAGWAGDRFGPRSVLMKVVLMWSFFTAATGWVWNYVSLLVCRALFGVGEAGCFPNATKIFTIWLPSSERVRAQGILWLSGALGRGLHAGDRNVGDDARELAMGIRNFWWDRHRVGGGVLSMVSRPASGT